MPWGLPAVSLIRRSCSSRPSTLRSGAATAASGPGSCAASCRAEPVACVRLSAGPVRRGSGFVRGARIMNGSRADRLDRTLFEIEAGRAGLAPSLIRVQIDPRSWISRRSHDHSPDKDPRPRAKRRSTLPCGAATSQCQDPTAGSCPARTLAFRAAARSGVTRGERRMTVHGEPGTSLLRLLTAPFARRSPPGNTGRPMGRPVALISTSGGGRGGI